MGPTNGMQGWISIAFQGITAVVSVTAVIITVRVSLNHLTGQVTHLGDTMDSLAGAVQRLATAVAVVESRLTRSEQDIRNLESKSKM